MCLFIFFTKFLTFFGWLVKKPSLIFQQGPNETAFRRNLISIECTQFATKQSATTSKCKLSVCWLSKIGSDFSLLNCLMWLGDIPPCKTYH